MKLHIDTSNSERVIVQVDGRKFTTRARKEKSQELLSFIDKVLRQNRQGIKDVTEIRVNRGPGSFTGLRVGISVANSLGWTLGILVNGKDIRKKGPVEPLY
ncbi:hypothetical protein CMO96_03705 [Candidatus Woesebacteria bacterium]|nr:hypothetical protein [Candidatus Woesebacteria bacterium]